MHLNLGSESTIDALPSCRESQGKDTLFDPCTYASVNTKAVHSVFLTTYTTRLCYSHGLVHIIHHSKTSEGVSFNAQIFTYESEPL